MKTQNVKNASISLRYIYCKYRNICISTKQLRELKVVCYEKYTCKTHVVCLFNTNAFYFILKAFCFKLIFE